MDSLSALVKQARNGRAEAFGQIVKRFQDMAWASAYAQIGDVHLAQDAAQEAFVEAFLKLDALRANMVYVLGKVEDPVSKRQQVAETGLTVADGFCREGYPVLLIVEGRVALTEGVAAFLRTHQSGSLTTLYLGEAPDGLEGANLSIWIRWWRCRRSVDVRGFIRRLIRCGRSRFCLTPGF